MPRVDVPINNAQVRERGIAEFLLGIRGGGTDWGQPYQSGGGLWSKKTANTFLLCCLLDYQIPSSQAWANGERLVKNILGDPDDVWRAITSISDSEWKSKRNEYKLHRFPAAHHRLWRIGKYICDEYGGDARRIWNGKDPAVVLQLLWAVGAGDQISRMIVGALRDCGQIKGTASDVKGDVYVRRVLGRALLGEPTDAETAVGLARRVYPDDPWQLDAPLWTLGSNACKATPVCSECGLKPYCSYAIASTTD